MPFNMRVSNDVINGLDVVPPGPYEVKLAGFAPKLSKKGDSVNLNPCMIIVGHSDFADRKIFDTLNSNGYSYADFSHCFGLPLETDGTSSKLPGEFSGEPSADPNTLTYKGPLVGRIGKIIVAVDNYNGKDNNKVERYICAVEDCATKFPKIRHKIDMLKKN